LETFVCTEKRRAAEAKAAAAAEAYEEASAEQQVDGSERPVNDLTSSTAAGSGNTISSGQQELLDKYYAGGDIVSAKQTLRLLAEDARYGLQRGVLDTVADIISLVAMQQTEAYQTQVSCVAAVIQLERSELNISKRVILPATQ
jgi:hypothetical protein